MKKILVVDDQKDILEMMKIVLEKTGDYSVVTTPNPLEVEALCRTHNPDLLVLDLVMPEMEGTQLIRILKKKPQTASIKIIVTSGLGEIVYSKKTKKWEWQPNNPLVEHRGSDIVKEKSAEKAAQLYGVDDYIAKPFTPATLLDVLKDVLNRSGEKDGPGEKPNIVLD